MPQPYYGESNSIKPGVYPAVISQVAVLGHHADKDGLTYRTKLWFAFYIPSFNSNFRLSNFGINNWATPSKAPFVGLNEVVCAALGQTEMDADEVAGIDIFSLLGKSVFVTLEENEKGYTNITKLSPYLENIPVDCAVEKIAVGIEDFSNEELVQKLDKKAIELIQTSREYFELSKPIDLEEEEIPVVEAEKVDNSKEELEKVPF